MMEERLEMVKRMMELEKEKRSMRVANSYDQTSLWRSASTSKSTKGYADMVLNHHRIVQPQLPPTTLIYKDDSLSNANNTGSQTGFNQTNNTLMNKKKLKNNLFGGSSTQTEKNFVSSSTGTNNEGGTQTEHSGFMPKPPKPTQQVNAANNLMKALKEQNEA